MSCFGVTDRVLACNILLLPIQIKYPYISFPWSFMGDLKVTRDASYQATQELALEKSGSKI